MEVLGVANLQDGSSGATRTGNIRILCDGVTVDNAIGNWQTPTASGNASCTALGRSTPTAASHTWTLQAKSSIASATLLSNASLTVREIH